MSDDDLGIDADIEAAIEDAGDPSIEEEIAAAMPEEEAEAVEAEPVEVIEPYAHWNDENKALFAAQAPDVQKFMLERQKDMDRSYTEKTTELADQRKQFETISQELAPFQGLIQQAGYTPAQATGEAMRAYAQYVTDPVNTIYAMAAEHGLTIAENNEEGYDNPELSSLRNELNQIRGSLAQQQEQENYAKEATATAQIQSFKNEVTDTGEPAHPHFDEVYDDIVKLARAEMADGQPVDLGQLYEKAVYMNPTVRVKLLSAQREATDKAEKEAARIKAEKSRLAGFNVKGGPGGPVPTEELSIEESIRSMMN